ncbi:MAG: DUF2125 domain-containing protein [Stellaceae bacterium]
MRRIASFKIAVIAIIVLLLAAAAGYSGYWFVTANALKVGLKAWTTNQRADGYDIAWSEPRITGFPLRFRIVLRHVALARGGPALYRVTAPLVTGEATPFDLSRWKVAAPGGARGTVQGVDGTIRAATMFGQVRIGPRHDRLALTAHTVTGEGATAGAIDAALTLPHQPPRSYHDPGLAARLQLFHLVLPEAVRPLGKTIESIAFDVTVEGGLPPGDWRAALREWSDSGGTVEINHAALQWGALRLEGNGTLALDQALQPEAAMTAAIINQDTLIDAALTSHLLTPGSAAVVKTVLDLLAKRGPDGTKRLTAPVTIQNQTLSVGNVRIGRLPTIRWR